MLALIFALEQFRHLILHYAVSVYTDHRPLLGILTKATKDAAITRWALLVQEYKINLYYLPGKENIFSDMLSRLVDVRDKCETLQDQLDDKLIEKVNLVNNEEEPLNSYIPPKAPWTEEELRREQQSDEKTQAMRKALRESVKENTLKLTVYKVLKDILYVYRSTKRAKFREEYVVPYVPDSLMPKAFNLIHNATTAAHSGYERTLRNFKKNFYNAKESQLVKDWCEKCESCIKAKRSTKPVPIAKYPIPEKPFTALSSDILSGIPLTKKGNKYILVIRDFTTRYSIFEAMPRKEADCIIEALRRVISNYGSCESLLTDNAQEYKSEKLKKFCNFFNIRKVEYSPFSPQSGGISERSNRELNKFLRMYVNDMNLNDWDELLPVLQLTVNNTYNQTIKETPFFALFGYDSPTVSLNPPKINYGEDNLSYHLNRVTKIRQHCRQTLLKTQDAYTDRTNSNRKNKSIHVGQRVFADLKKHIGHHKKLDFPIAGPLQVIGTKGRAFRLKTTGETDQEYVVHPDNIIISPSQLTPPLHDPKPVSLQEDDVMPDTGASDLQSHAGEGAASVAHSPQVTHSPTYGTGEPSSPTVVTHKPETNTQEPIEMEDKIPTHRYNLRPRNS